MPRTCTVCSHDKRSVIDTELVRRAPCRNITQRFSVSKFALSRHAKEHLPELLKKAYGAEEAARADELLGQVRALQSKTLSILLSAEGAGELRTALSAIREARGNVELLAKLSGELQQEGTTTNYVFISPAVTEIIARALAPYPEAGYAVSAALKELEEGSP